jgi:hypothetical protein
MPDGGGYLTQVGSTLSRPADTMSWTQLAAATVFVLLVAVAWRQVTLMIMREL